ncbi:MULTISPECIES: SMI1/KNR4 family protein [unclassified Paenibacillus]|uniref:SMI1/KNR4 family protein n=1 Tax=unclassified Paenibacillus TaxID=185978 RepID=UPI002F3E586B
MKNNIEKFINWAREEKWNIIEQSKTDLNLDKEIVTRYKEFPPEYKLFLKMVKQCITPNDKTWFVCESEYNNESEFRWNEFEWLSLEAAENDGNWKSDIIKWWDNYLPIVMSVDGGYSFYAMDLTYDAGAIVRGYEPEFEEVEKVADNLDEFLQLIMSNAIIM